MIISPLVDVRVIFFIVFYTPDGVMVEYWPYRVAWSAQGGSRLRQRGIISSFGREKEGNYSCLAHLTPQHSQTFLQPKMISKSISLLIPGDYDSCVTMSSLIPGSHICSQISGSLGTPTAGQNYTLTCNIHGIEGLNLTLAYLWTKNNNTHTSQVVEANSSTLSFSSLRLSHAGDYTCEVVVNSHLLTSDVTLTSHIWRIRIQSKLHHSLQSICSLHESSPSSSSSDYCK